jgi:hypothetical protein
MGKKSRICGFFVDKGLANSGFSCTIIEMTKEGAE